MLFTYLVKDYFIWHYTTAIKELIHIWKNFLWFTIHLFSIPQLLKTWISPWKRVREEQTRTWNLEGFIGRVLIGLLSRIIGFFVRTVFIVVGGVFLSITILTGLSLFISWFLLPILPLTLIALGIAIIIIA